jgi:hypothetical protein
MTTTTIRVSKKTHRTLTVLSQEQQASMTDLIDAAVELYRRQQLLQATNAAYAALRADSAAWQELQDERAAWEGTVGDGLIDERSMNDGTPTIPRRYLDSES